MLGLCKEESLALELLYEAGGKEGKKAGVVLARARSLGHDGRRNGRQAVVSANRIRTPVHVSTLPECGILKREQEYSHIECVNREPVFHVSKES